MTNSEILDFLFQFGKDQGFLEMEILREKLEISEAIAERLKHWKDYSHSKEDFNDNMQWILQYAIASANIALANWWITREGR